MNPQAHLTARSSEIGFNPFRIAQKMLKDKYSSHFEFYMVREINQIIQEQKSPHEILYYDYLVFDDRQEIMRRYYTQSESYLRLRNYTDYYSGVMDYQRPCYEKLNLRVIMDKRQKRQLKLIKRNDENKSSKNNSEEAESHMHVNDNILRHLNQQTLYLEDIDFRDRLQNFRDNPSLTHRKHQKNRENEPIFELNQKCEVHDIYEPAFSSEEEEEAFSRCNGAVKASFQMNFGRFENLNISIDTLIPEIDKAEESQITKRDESFITKNSMLRDFQNHTEQSEEISKHVEDKIDARKDKNSHRSLKLNFNKRKMKENVILVGEGQEKRKNAELKENVWEKKDGLNKNGTIDQTIQKNFEPNNKSPTSQTKSKLRIGKTNLGSVDLKNNKNSVRIRVNGENSLRAKIPKNSKKLMKKTSQPNIEIQTGKRTPVMKFKMENNPSDQKSVRPNLSPILSKISGLKNSSSFSVIQLHSQFSKMAITPQSIPLGLLKQDLEENSQKIFNIHKKTQKSPFIKDLFRIPAGEETQISSFKNSNSPQRLGSQKVFGFNNLIQLFPKEIKKKATPANIEKKFLEIGLKSPLSNAMKNSRMQKTPNYKKTENEKKIFNTCDFKMFKSSNQKLLSEKEPKLKMTLPQKQKVHLQKNLNFDQLLHKKNSDKGFSFRFVSKGSCMSQGKQSLKNSNPGKTEPIKEILLNSQNIKSPEFSKQNLSFSKKLLKPEENSIGFKTSNFYKSTIERDLILKSSSGKINLAFPSRKTESTLVSSKKPALN